MSLLAAMASDLVTVSDPVELARRCGLNPHDYQKRVLRSKERQLLLNWSRQAGKSTATSILPLHQALYTPGSLTLLVGPSDRQATMLLEKCYDHLYALGWKAAKDEKDNIQSLHLRNKSQIVALPGKGGTIRGYSNVALVVIDEAAKTPEEVWVAVRPMVAASGGRMILLFTPFGKRGFAYRAWTGQGNWERHEVPYTQVPHLDPLVIAEDRLEMSEAEFNQEYCCIFREMDDAIFSDDMIALMFSDDVKPLFAIGSGMKDPWADIPTVEAPAWRKTR